MTVQVPVAPGIFTWPSEAPRLIGSRCKDCGTHAFPAQSGCAKCTGSDTTEVELGTEGTLWAWTVQGFPPKAPPYVGNTDPATFVPYGVGYVELPGEVKVEARLTINDPARLRVGMPMRMVLETLSTDEDGNDIVTFAFAPAETEEGDQQ
jgi:uncharacterized OB-fold protein